MANEYVTDTTLKATLSLTGETFADADITAACTAASRAIDDMCGRRFWKDTSNTDRYFSPMSAVFLPINDLADFSALVCDFDGDGTFEETWTENTDFVFEPLNAETDGRPRTGVRVHPSNTKGFPTRYPRSVKVTGKWGWDAVPPAIIDATSILAHALVRRKREAPFGIVAFGVEEAVRIGRSDPHVSMLVAPYVRFAI